jgi:ABC-type multidrug transport system ATPase subunit
MSVGRTIVLTTHFMDEADLLGQTVSIMSKGQLKCSGSPFYLKQQLGAGYTLTVSCGTSAVAEQLTELVHQYVATASVVSQSGGELSLRLPTESVPQFPALLAALEARPDARGFGIGVTTLEEIFLRIGEAEQLDDPTTPGLLGSALTKSATAVKFEERAEKNTAQTPLWSDEELSHAVSPAAQLMPLVVKRFHNSRRDTRTILLQIVMPVIGITLAMLFQLITFPDAPRLVLRSDSYPTTELTVGNCGSTFGNYAQPGADVTLHNATSGWLMSDHLLSTFKQHKVDRVTAMTCLDSHIWPAPAVVLFSNESYSHGTPMAVADYHSMYSRNALASAAPSWVIASKPLPIDPYEQAQFDAFVTFFIGMFILIPFTFIPSTFVSWIVKEREVRAKHLQIVSGMNYVVYWVANFLFDIASFIITSLLSILVFVIFDRSEYIGTTELFFGVFVLFMMYGFAGIAGSYTISFAFESHSTAQNIVLLANFVCGFLLVMIVKILSFIESTKEAADVLVFIFRVVPAFCLGDGILNLAAIDAAKAFVAVEQHAFDMDVLGWNLVYMAIEIPVFIAITFVLDHPARKMRAEMLFGEQGVEPEVIEEEDEDVTAERRAVEAGRPGDFVTVKNLRKTYPVPTGDGTKVAVRNLSFGVHEAEVFAFLGTNGAGKTTTISVLCGEVLPTRGAAFVADKNVVTDALETRRIIGYCPQFDALHDLMTPVEHLYLYAGLRGLDRAVQQRVVERLIDVCGLSEHRDKLSQTLSGGNKRKRSVAISLMGGPQVVFLDEPSAGMDPQARHGMWEVIERIAQHCSVVLTTHHLEEVEALADRMAIMVDGEMKCIGNLQHLKNKFGSGFEMTLRVNESEAEADVLAFIAEHVEGAKLEENRNQKMTFALPQTTVLSALFGRIEARKADLGIIDYAICQSSVEQVFLRISAGAQAQDE